MAVPGRLNNAIDMLVSQRRAASKKGYTTVNCAMAIFFMHISACRIRRFILSLTIKKTNGAGTTEKKIFDQ